MITDSQTNVLYLSALLKENHEKFYNELLIILRKHNIEPILLENTKDIWCRDYMPIQINEKEFVQFTFQPSYYKHDLHLQTNPEEIYNINKIYPTDVSYIKLDGGNVIRMDNKVIITDWVFNENDCNTIFEKNKLKRHLKNILEVNEVIIIEHQKGDISGHADGMVRFINDNKVIINEAVYGTKSLYKKLKRTLLEHELEVIDFPYELCNEKNNVKDYTAKGYYINYLHIGNLIVLPSFGFPKDELAKEEISSLFPENKIESIDCNEIAFKGGVLNCISWNIFKKR